MSETSDGGRGFAALKQRDFSLIVVGGSFLLTVAILAQEVALGIALYELTGDPLTLGLIGLAEAIPFIAVALFGGAIADRYPRKKIALLALVMILLGSVALELVMRASDQLEQTSLLWMVYLSIAWIGLARGFYSPALSALRAEVTPRDLYANASAWASNFWQTGAVVGPVLGGFLYAWIGLKHTLIVVIVIMLVSLLLIGLVRSPAARPTPPKEPMWRSIAEGFHFVWNSRLLLYTISLDLVAVLFGGVMAILPAFAKDVLQIGPEWVGWLRAAPSVGAVLMLVFLTRHSPTRHLWRNMLLAVFGFGAATVGFALSSNIWLSMAMLFLAGAFDSISVVVRQYLLQVVPPEHLRGRVLSVNSIFVTSSNELGAFVSGAGAKLMGLVPSVLAGASLTFAAGALAWIKGRDLLQAKL